MKMPELSIENIETALWFANIKRVDALKEKYVGNDTIRDLAEALYVNLPVINTGWDEQLDWLRKEING